jgi:anthranilate synthase component 2
MLCLIDNYDSFTYNIAQYLKELDAEIWLVKNDEVTVEEIMSRPVSGILVSPGPCTPNEAGISMTVMRECAGKLPVLGICLGHEAVGQAFGSRVVHANNVMHGKVSEIHHSGAGVFSSLPSPFKATRYHSLVIEPESLSEDLEVTAWTQNSNGEFDEIMGVRHKDYDIEGVQFHPEAILTEYGHNLLNNFLHKL